MPGWLPLEYAHLTDLSDLLRSVGSRNAAFPVPHSRGDEGHTGSGQDQMPGLRLGSGIKVPTRDFR